MARPGKLPWDKNAERELGKVPFFVRPLVRKKVEERVQGHGGKRVTLDDYREAEARHKAVMAGKSEDEIKKMFPRPNSPGIEMTVLEVCHNELSDCPNPAINTAQWREALEKWIGEMEISERLRSRVGEDTIKFHHKLRLSVSGCPNGCSRPQIADIGIVGFVTPDFDPAECESCGACAEVCPDEAIHYDGGPPWFNFNRCLGCKLCYRACSRGCIELSEPAARITIGGKLGRHPHLAETIAEVSAPEEAIKIIEPIVLDFIISGRDGERFADYWIRRGKEKNHG